ncbi:MAG: Lrp/AsnC family transcriptional regulator [Candidatus Baldrarchaeia archaeon]
MDEIDLAIIEYLKKDARTSFREIARKLKVSPDTIVNRFRMLQKKGII